MARRLDTGFRVRILLINDYDHPVGGAERIVLNLRAELRKRGHDVRLLTSDAMINRLTPEGDFHCRGTTGSLRTLLQCGNFSAWLALRRALVEFRPDVVHVNLYLTQLSPLILECLGNVPTVYYAQWYRAICPLGTRRLPDSKLCAEPAGWACLKNGCLPWQDWIPLQAQRVLNARWHGTFDRVAAISHAVAEKLLTFGGELFKEIEVIHAGTPDTPCRTEVPEFPVFAFAGRLVPEKGCDVLLRAFAKVAGRIPDARLVVIGDGPEQSRLRLMAAALQLSKQVDFRGSLGNLETRQAMREAWALCVPSLWDEPFGLVAVEAQMSGVPVIASRCGGLVEIATPDSGGILLAPGDVDGLAEAMVSIASDRQQPLTRGRAAHHRALQAFRLSTFAERFETLYSSIVRSGHQ